MKLPSCLIFFILLFPLLHINNITRVEAHDLVEASCKEVQYVDLCVKTLRSNPQTPKATNKKELSLIMLKISASYANENFKVVNKLIRGPGSKNRELKDCLDQCWRLYRMTVINNYPSAIRAVGLKDYYQANQELMSAIDNIDSCSDAFEGSPGLRIPTLETMTRAASELGLIALQLVGQN